jgi:hypothetical protein
MTELDLLNLARAATVNEIGYFTQVITINFAMIVAIYYFLNQARLAMKLFAFLAYMVGMLLFLGQMLLETNLKDTLLQTLAALPHVNAVTARYLALNDTWLAVATRVLFNGAFWILGVGTFYLLFFWKKAAMDRGHA